MTIQVIFSSLMPFVPMHESARNTKESNFVQREDDPVRLEGYTDLAASGSDVDTCGWNR